MIAPERAPGICWTHATPFLTMLKSLRLRELAIDYIQQADRLEAENRGHVAESDELISAALDAVARDYFGRALSKAKSRTKA